MSYYRRGYSWEQVDYIPAPVGGWNPDAPVHELPDTQAPILDNFLLRPGQITMRGQIRRYVDLAAAIGGSPGPFGYCGGVAATRYSLIGRKDVTTGTVDQWNAPLNNNLSLSLAASKGCVLIDNSGIDGFDAPGASSLPTIPVPMRSTILDGLIYCLAYSDTVTLTDPQHNYTLWSTKMFTLPLADYAAATVMANAPQGGFDIKSYLSRIWILGGTIRTTATGIIGPILPNYQFAGGGGPGTNHFGNILFFTNPITAGGGVNIADWQDPISGLENAITMDNNTDDFGVALALVRNGMVIFRRSSVWILRGTTTSNFQLQAVSREVGCIDQRSVVETETGIYFLSNQGLMFTDGTSVRNVSGTIGDQLRAVISNLLVNITYAIGGYASCTLTSQNQLLVSIGTGDFNTGTTGTYPMWSGMLDLNTGGWVRLTSNLFTDNLAPGNLLPGIFLRNPTTKRLYVIGDQYVYQLECLETGNSFVLPESQAHGALYDYDATLGANIGLYPIPAQWVTRFAGLATNTQARKWAQAKRFFADYQFAFNNLGVYGNAWTVQPMSAAQAAYGGSTVLLAAAPSGGLLLTQIMRENVDFANEVDDLLFQVTWPSPNYVGAGILVPGGSPASMYGIGVEFQPARDRR